MTKPNSQIATRTEHARVTQWNKHGDHPAVMRIKWFDDKGKTIFPENRGTIKASNNPYMNTNVESGACVIEYLHSCECGGELYKASKLTPFEIGLVDVFKGKRTIYHCKSCDRTRPLEKLETGRIEVLTAEQYKESKWRIE